MNDKLKKLASTISVLIVEDDEFTLDIYESIFSKIFFKVYLAKDGREALDIWLNQSQNIDLVITDILMPNLDGYGLIQKIRENSPSQNIVVLTSVDDFNEMKDIVNMGVDGIILKPYDEEKVFSVLNRILKVIKSKKIMKRQIYQLKLLASQSVQLKQGVLKQNKEKKVLIEDSVLEKKVQGKYNIRKTFHNAVADDVSSDIDYLDMENVDELLSSLNKYESLLVNIETKSNEDIISVVLESTEVLTLFISTLKRFSSFDVAIDASTNLNEFILNFDITYLEDKEKKELFFNAYLALFEDISSWLDTMFSGKESGNVNYFDASFANTCLELESIYMILGEDDESDLEFF